MESQNADMDQLALLNKLIEERENDFQRALRDAAGSDVVTMYKNELDFLKEQRAAIFRNSFNKPSNQFLP